MKRSIKDDLDAIEEKAIKGRHHVDANCDDGIISITGHREFYGLSSFDEFQYVNKPNMFETLLGITLESKVRKSMAKMQMKCDKWNAQLDKNQQMCEEFNESQCTKV